MKYRYVFLLGRAGCGKSALYRELERRILESGRGITFERVDDFPKLWAKILEDDAREKEGKDRIHSTYIEGVYRITDEEVFNAILKEVNAELLKIDKPDHLVFLEFARSNCVEAIQNFDERILDNCMAIYMQVSFDTCCARIAARHEAAIAEDGDDHLIPRDVMERFYLHDDQDAFVRYMEDRGIPIVVVDNEADGEEHLKGQVGELFRFLL